jgi:RNA polymerase sigma factor (TIGR02999 family)
MSDGTPHPGAHEVTILLNRAGQGDAKAAAELLPKVYDELRVLAKHRMAQERGGGAGMTLQPTALVHEAYVRLVKDGEAQWSGRNHFFSAAAIAMRRILVERARAVAGPKRGGGKARVDLEAVQHANPGGPEVVDWIGLDDALTELEKHDARLAQLVMLRFFAGLSFEKVGEVLGISDRHAKREWNVARAWLYQRMTGEKPEAE